MWAYLLLLMTAVVWGGAFVVIKWVVAEWHPLTAATVRFVLAFGALLPAWWWLEGRRELVETGAQTGAGEKKSGFNGNLNSTEKWRSVLLLIFLGFSGVFVYNLCFFYGMQWTTAVNASLVVNASPVVTAVLSALLLKEQLRLQQLFGFAVSLAGVAVIVSKGSWELLYHLRFNQGDVLMAVAGIAWSFYSVGGKLAMNRFSPVFTNVCTVGIGALMLGAAAAAKGLLFAWPSTPGLASTAGLFYLAVFASAICFVTWFKGIQSVGAGKASVFQNVVPLSAALLAVVVLGEELASYHLIGATLIFGGVYLVNRRSYTAPVTGYAERNEVLSVKDAVNQ